MRGSVFKRRPRCRQLRSRRFRDTARRGSTEDKMRRRLERYIPIVLFAILVQLIAPVSALLAVASAVSDPLYMVSICSNMSDDGHAKPSDGTGSQQGCCEACG